MAPVSRIPTWRRPRRRRWRPSPRARLRTRRAPPRTGLGAVASVDTEPPPSSARRLPTGGERVRLVSAPRFLKWEPSRYLRHERHVLTLDPAVARGGGHDQAQRDPTELRPTDPPCRRRVQGEAQAALAGAGQLQHVAGEDLVADAQGRDDRAGLVA